MVMVQDSKLKIFLGWEVVRTDVGNLEEHGLSLLVRNDHWLFRHSILPKIYASIAVVSSVY
jgi:hypothetical protein